jgi:L-lactate dehydrogenase (cytochrome)
MIALLAEAEQLGRTALVLGQPHVLGNQLDAVLSTVRALPSVADAVGDQAIGLADGGVRSGLDVVRMLSLGAKDVLIGRALVYALAARGEQGVSHMPNLLSAEMKVAMALTGCTRIDAIGRNVIADAPRTNTPLHTIDFIEERGMA